MESGKATTSNTFPPAVFRGLHCSLLRDISTDASASRHGTLERQGTFLGLETTKEYEDGLEQFKKRTSIKTDERYKK